MGDVIIKYIEETVKYIEEKEKYIEEKEKTLCTAITRIFDLFGNSNICANCGFFDFQHGKDYKGACNSFKPKIHISVDLISPPFYEKVMDNGELEFRLATTNGRIAIAKESAYGDDYVYLQPKDVDIDVLKEMVKSGVLPQFLAHVAEEMAKMANEYEEVAEIAQKMADAVTS